MAIYLFKLIRRKIRENQAKKAVPTTNEFHLVPEIAPGQEQHSKLYSNNHEHESTRRATPTKNLDHSIDPAEAARQKEEARKRNIRQWKLMIGLALPNFLASVDVTIVAPAIPLISSHFSTFKSVQDFQAPHHTNTSSRPPLR